MAQQLSAECRIDLEEPNGSIVHSTREVMLALRQRLKEDRNRLIALGISERVTERILWACSVFKRGKRWKALLLCSSWRTKQKFIRRQHFPLPNRGEILREMVEAKYFSMLGLSAQFLQVPIGKRKRACAHSASPLEDAIFSESYVTWFAGKKISW